MSLFIRMGFALQGVIASILADPPLQSRGSIAYFFRSVTHFENKNCTALIGEQSVDSWFAWLSYSLLRLALD